MGKHREAVEPDHQADRHTQPAKVGDTAAVAAVAAAQAFARSHPAGDTLAEAAVSRLEVALAAWHRASLEGQLVDSRATLVGQLVDSRSQGGSGKVLLRADLVEADASVPGKTLILLMADPVEVGDAFVPGQLAALAL